ncbi:isopentenyl-diphosphate Delta-isomerase [Nocardioides sp. AX2bis]|uniref:isopentenyl-diphosphate Delta-isomerase n=1 Tax=Nocardioides sp. AX2bis TaxID=2653157 RepID=UPI0012F14D66|nr:isopentenyl-diphosphate Delta-isomerase [Nocardioides sp. AX2bis]VXB31976.1 Isopentenyl-diphosphate Delta-isomerase [Nocardioides sp. AX2bis]
MSGVGTDGGVEQVVLLDEDGRAVGRADKATVHHQDTPLHLAFSCYVFDRQGRFLLTQRAASKRTWPAVWTNSACGHPAPDEPFLSGVRRRVGQELGLDLAELRLVLPAFRYRAVMADGTVENEMCPVTVAVTDDEPRADPDEVDAAVWVDWAEFRAEVLSGRREVSPWCVQQVEALPADPLAAADQDPATLPPAARPPG